jgi:ketopantoate reductase
VQADDLMIAFGSLDDDPQRSLKVGQRVVEVLKNAGFDVHWENAIEQRIQLPAFKWQRRSP